MLVYSIPREPSSLRVSAWRKLKKLGAVLMHDAAWVLPDNPRTREALQWIAAEVDEAGGKAAVWVARAALAGQDSDLERSFLEQVEPGYSEVLEALARPDADLDALARRYRELRDRDHLGSDLGPAVREALLAARGRGP